MDTLQRIRALWEHALWADGKVFEAVRGSDAAPAEALAELAHILGAYEVWLSRLQKRPSRAAVWPEASLAEAAKLWDDVKVTFREYLSSLGPGDMDALVTYRNSAGDQFESSVGDILVHLALHAQYHRGKVNLLLRQAGSEPAPSDYIAFVRGAPAATRSTDG